VEENPTIQRSGHKHVSNNTFLAIVGFLGASFSPERTFFFGIYVVIFFPEATPICDSWDLYPNFAAIFPMGILQRLSGID
jgi:hypothetical protein